MIVAWQLVSHGATQQLWASSSCCGHQHQAVVGGLRAAKGVENCMCVCGHSSLARYCMPPRASGGDSLVARGSAAV
jgi:hypothetical protein